MVFFLFSTLLLMVSVFCEAFSISFAAVREMIKVHEPVLRDRA